MLFFLLTGQAFPIQRFERRQCLQCGCTARGQRCGTNKVACPLHLNWLNFLSLIGGQILSRNDASVLLECGRNLMRDVAAIKGIGRPTFG